MRVNESLYKIALPRHEFVTSASALTCCFRDRFNHILSSTRLIKLENFIQKVLCVYTLTYSSVRSLKDRMEFSIMFPNFKPARVGDPCEVHLSSKLGVNLLREKNRNTWRKTL